MASETPTTPEQLQQENQTLRARVAELEELIGQLPKDRQLFQDRLEQAHQAPARQAAPFRRPERTKVPQGRQRRPGRPPGHPGACRVVPGQVDEQARVPLDGCPCCGGPLSHVEPVEQFIEDLPPRRPHVTRIVTYKATCPHCGEVRSTHPLPMSDATGAAQVQLGPRAVALNKRFGLTIRTTCRVPDQLGGLRVTPGGLTQAFARVADKFADVYDRLIDDLRHAAAVFADETSWCVGTPGHWLWSFTNATTTVYVVDPHRDHAVPLRILGADFAGMLVSDCLSSDDPLPDRNCHGPRNGHPTP